jgi:hypothetical protein
VPHPARSAVELARAISDALEAAELPYAIGGALALAYYAPPRATVDVDVNVFVPPRGGVEPIVNALRSVGFEPDEPPEALNARASRDGQFRGHCEGMRVDVFVPAIDYYAELESRRRVVQVGGRSAWILAPEDLAILKMMFFRRKDLADVEALLRDQGPDVDVAFVRDKLVELVGSDDERVRELDDIIKDVATPEPR